MSARPKLSGLTATGAPRLAHGQRVVASDGATGTVTHLGATFVGFRGFRPDGQPAVFVRARATVRRV